LLDLTGAGHGLRARLLRLAQWGVYEMNVLGANERALTDGHHVVFVPVRSDADRRKMVGVLALAHDEISVRARRACGDPPARAARVTSPMTMPRMTPCNNRKAFAGWDERLRRPRGSLLCQPITCNYPTFIRSWASGSRLCGHVRTPVRHPQDLPPRVRTELPEPPVAPATNTLIVNSLIAIICIPTRQEVSPAVTPLASAVGPTAAQPTRSAISTPDMPSAAHSTSRARSTRYAGCPSLALDASNSRRCREYRTIDLSRLDISGARPRPVRRARHPVTAARPAIAGWWSLRGASTTVIPQSRAPPRVSRLVRRPGRGPARRPAGPPGPAGTAPDGPRRTAAAAGSGPA
jgi:hypothetical protein